MKLYAFVNPGMEDFCKQEIKEILDVSGKVYPHIVEFEASAEQALTLLYHGQSMRRIAVSLGKYKNLDEAVSITRDHPRSNRPRACSASPRVARSDPAFSNSSEINDSLPVNTPVEKADFNSVSWKEFINSSSFKAEVENVKGIENRLALAKTVAGKVFSAVEKQKLSLTIDLKKPDFLLMVYFNGEEYFIGIDLAGEELHSRAYRVFTHSASCKGDLGYFFARKTGYKSGNNLLVGFAKDGVVAIEAALFASRMPVQPANKHFSYKKIPIFSSVKYQPLTPNTSISIAAVDDSTQNITAARKNSQIAGVRKQLNIQKIVLDELSGAFHEHEFDHVLFQVTTKDEEKLNEIYHQVKYLLKPKGTLLLIGRQSWEISVPSYCKLVSEEVLERGGNSYKLWLMQKK